MVYIFSGLLFVIGLIAINKEKNLFNPLSLFCILWAAILFFSKLQLYSLYPADEKIYKMIIYGVSSYVIGYLLAKIFIGNKRLALHKKEHNPGSIRLDYVPNYSFLYFLLFFSLLFYLKDLVTVFTTLVGGGSLANIQSLIQGTDNLYSRTGLENAIRLLIVNPFTWAVIPILAVDIWMGRRDKKLIILTGLLIVSRIFTTGGRAAFLNFAIYMSVVFGFVNIRVKKVLTDRPMNNIKKNKRLFKILLCIALVILAIMTYSRAGQRAIRTIYFDFAMQPYMCQIWMEKVDTNNMIGYGTVSLTGFIFPILYVMKNLLRIFPIPMAYQQLFDMRLALDTEWQWIGQHVYANAYTSIFWYLYIDGRVIGIILGLFIYGFVSRIVFCNTMKNINVKNICLYSLFYIGIFYTFVRCQFTSIDYALAIIFVAFFTYKGKHMLNKKG